MHIYIFIFKIIMIWLILPYPKYSIQPPHTVYIQLCGYYPIHPLRLHKILTQLALRKAKADIFNNSFHYIKLNIYINFKAVRYFIYLTILQTAKILLTQVVNLSKASLNGAEADIKTLHRIQEIRSCPPKHPRHTNTI